MRNLSDDDIKALTDALRNQGAHQCPCTTFSNEEIQFVKTWLELWKTTRSEVLKWLVQLVLIAIGASFFIWMIIKSYATQLGVKG